MDPAFVRAARGDLVWNALLLLTVFLPLASLTVDVPEYFSAASYLEQALAASSQDAANACLDLQRYSQSGLAALDPHCLRRTAQQRFAQATAELAAMGHRPALVHTACRTHCQEVTLRGTVAVRVFFALSPALTITREATSRARMTAG